METGGISKTSVKNTNDFDKIEELTSQAVEYLFGDEPVEIETVETEPEETPEEIKEEVKKEEPKKIVVGQKGNRTEGNYFSFNAGCGLTIPIGRVGEVLGIAITPLGGV